MIVVFEDIWPNIRIVILLQCNNVTTQLWAEASVSYDQTQS